MDRTGRRAWPGVARAASSVHVGLQHAQLLVVGLQHAQLLVVGRPTNVGRRPSGRRRVCFGDCGTVEFFLAACSHAHDLIPYPILCMGKKLHRVVSHIVETSYCMGKKLHRVVSHIVWEKNSTVEGI